MSTTDGSVKDRERDLMWTTTRILERYQPISSDMVQERRRELSNKYGVKHLVK